MLRYLTVLAVLSLPACIDSAAVDAAFCDADETCEPAGPSPVVCGGDICGVDVLADVCATKFACHPDADICIATEVEPGQDDKNACTHDVCEDGAWKHVPLTAKEMDDGDPCTLDECDAVSGITHTKSCA